MITCEFSIFSSVEMWSEPTLRQQFGHGEDMRVKKEEQDPWAISKSKEDLIDSMLNLIINHKKSLKLIPQCSHPDTAREWASKRGLSVSTPDLDNDPATQEVVVWDKSGRYPYVVNGYKLARSDFPTRHAYWGTHKTAESRLEEPMDEWIENKVYNVNRKPDNRWIVDTVGMTELGQQIEKYKYGMPTKPKKMMTPYAIFSKLIAPLVKDVWTTKAFYDAVGAEWVPDKTSYIAMMFRKIVSPISIYRALYLRLVEQKFFFIICDKVGGNPIKYEEFKKYMKSDQGKTQFYSWFYQNYLAGPDKSEFNKNVIDIDIVCENLVPPRDLNAPIRQIDMLFHLLGDANFNSNEPFLYDVDGVTATLAQVLSNDKIAKVAFKVLEDKSHESYKKVKRMLEKAKRISQKSIEKYLGKDNVYKIVSDYEAYAEYRKSVAKTGTPNHNLPPSPVKAAGVMEQGAPPQEMSGQRRMTDYFGPSGGQ